MYQQQAWPFKRDGLGSSCDQTHGPGYILFLILRLWDSTPVDRIQVNNLLYACQI